MKIAFISDLHVDISLENRKLIDHLIERLHSIEPDAFIIAGDITAKTQLLEKTLHKFSEISCKKFFVPGNHDIWIDSPSSVQEGIHSGIKYYKLLPQVCERNGFTFLGIEPQQIDGIGFAGTIGWYDYTMRNKKYDNSFSMETYSKKQYKEKYTWNDLHFAHWMDSEHNRRKPDEEVAQEMEVSLKQQIQFLNEKGVKSIVVVTHHVPFPEMISYQNLLPWDFFSAFMGSEGLGRIILEESAVTHVICGHSHIINHFTIGKIKAMKSPVGYPREWRVKDLHALIEERLGYFEIQ